MKVSEVMNRSVQIARSNQTICEAARMMADYDVGALPVGGDDGLMGIITDRDIAIRAVALGRSPDTSIKDVMSDEVLFCMENDDLDDVADQMADEKVRRLPVLDSEGTLIGIVSLGDLAQTKVKIAGRALENISEPGGEHSQQLRN